MIASKGTSAWKPHKSTGLNKLFPVKIFSFHQSSELLEITSCIICIPIAIISIHITYYIIYITIMSPFDIPTMTIIVSPSQPFQALSGLLQISRRWRRNPRSPRCRAPCWPKSGPGTAPQSEDPVVVWAGTELRCFWTCLNSFKGGALTNPKSKNRPNWRLKYN